MLCIYRALGMPSLIGGCRPRSSYSDERVPINIAPEVRDRLNQLLYSDAFMGTGVGFSAFIDRACEAAEIEYAEGVAMRSNLPLLMSALEAAAEAYPDQRSGQLIANALPFGRDVFYIEDRDLATVLFDYAADALTSE